jgi:putative peptidoglycan lipid II flippase
MTLENTIALSMAYLLPASAFLVASSMPIVSLIYGWGNFDADSVGMTSVCLASYSVGFSFSIAASLIYRYAQGLQKLGTIVALTYITVALNGFLDWLFVTNWGLLGLTMATSATQIAGFILYFVAINGHSLTRYLLRIKFFEQAVSSGILAMLAWLCGRWGNVVQLSASGLIFLFYLAAAERLGLMNTVPAHWRPTKLAEFILTAAKSYLSGK